MYTNKLGVSFLTVSYRVKIKWASHSAAMTAKCSRQCRQGKERERLNEAFNYHVLILKRGLFFFHFTPIFCSPPAETTLRFRGAIHFFRDVIAARVALTFNYSV